MNGADREIGKRTRDLWAAIPDLSGVWYLPPPSLPRQMAAMATLISVVVSPKSQEQQ
jgi:hypothetical protein